MVLSKDFTLIEKRIYRKIYGLSLEHNIKISNLYSMSYRLFYYSGL